MTVAAALLLRGAALGAVAEPISWEQAAEHVGEDAIVDGRVLGIHCSPLSCLLAFEPTFNRFTVVVEARSFEKMPPDSLERYTGRRVRVSGRIQQVDGKPEIVIESPDALTMPEEKEHKGDEGERLARAQTEVLERLGDVLARVEEMTERLAATQERVEALLARLEEREAALASLPPQPQLPVPSDGEPQPRPAWEALRTVKRGMTTAEVERLVGSPQYVENSPGWTTWYYGYGRSISFDSRGRAKSLVGFPGP
jgi:hypothetical protein